MPNKTESGWLVSFWDELVHRWCYNIFVLRLSITFLSKLHLIKCYIHQYLMSIQNTHGMFSCTRLHAMPIVYSINDTSGQPPKGA